MILFLPKDFKTVAGCLKIPVVLLVGLIGAQTAFALQVEAPQEIMEHVLAYSNEAGAGDKNAILRVSVVKNTYCNAFVTKLIDRSSGKTIKEIESCFTDLPNVALQNAIYELFEYKNLNYSVKNNNPVNPSIKTALIGVGFVATGLIFYYSKPPKPVRYSKNKISEVAE